MASDMRLNDKPIAKDGAYIYAEAADGSQVKISKEDLASVVAGQVRKLAALGDDSAVFGNVWIEDNYSNGHIVTVGQISGTGLLFIGYGVKPSKSNPNVYVSTTPINIKRTIFLFDLFGIRTGSTSDIVSVDVGNEVAISFS